MTKETIIIDGVNVSECVFRGTNRLGNDIGTYCRLYTGSCKKENCYYKQLQRKISECVKLEKDVEEWHIKYAGCNTANSSIQELNKRLKEDLTALQQTYDACEKEYKRVIEENKKLKELLCK